MSVFRHQSESMAGVAPVHLRVNMTITSMSEFAAPDRDTPSVV